ncbi:MAG: hypothetical protein RLZZ301_569 [Bacteroidota bacterium]|jgi:dihydrofolate synthase/folylpolyglutamate synthase
MTSYQECVNWLFERFPAFQQVGASAYKPGLERVELLFKQLEIEADAIPSIHIAGTNGKGSTAAYCASLLQEKGFRVGLFTSPHIYDFSERIRVNGHPIQEDIVIDFCQHIRVQLHDSEASFFELTFALAMRYFQDQNCDFLVIETGMGGRLDATNIIHPKCSVITSIGFDHEQFLGNSLALIAAEKAGIIKAQTPCVIGTEQEEIHSVFEHAAQEVKAPLHFAYKTPITHPIPIQLKGYQAENFRTALVTLDVLGFPCTATCIENSIKNLTKNTGFFGRLSLLQETPRIIADVSHNEAGMRASLALIEEMDFTQLYIIYGASSDKDSQKLLEVFPKNAQLFACLFRNPRSKTKADFELLGIQKVYSGLNLALQDIMPKLEPKDLLWITGSFFLLSDLNPDNFMVSLP